MSLNYSFRKVFVLKVGVIFTFFLLSNFSIAADAVLTKNEYMAFNTAYKTMKKGNSSKSLAILAKYFNFTNRLTDAPVKVLELAALGLEKENKFKSALSIYFALIRRNFDSIDLVTINEFKASGSADNIDKLPTKLYNYYYKMSLIYSKMLLDSYSQRNQKDSDYLKAKFFMYSSICERGDYKKGKVKSRQSSISNKLSEITKNKKSFGWSLYFGQVAWEDNILVNAGRRRHQFNATSSASCLGGGLYRRNYYWGWKIDACYAHGISRFEKTDALPFSPPAISNINVFLISPSIRTSFGLGEIFDFGLVIPILYRQGEYTFSNALETIIADSGTQVGVMLELEFRLDKFGIASQAGFLGTGFSKVLIIQGTYYL